MGGVELASHSRKNNSMPLVIMSTLTWVTGLNMARMTMMSRL